MLHSLRRLLARWFTSHTSDESSARPDSPFDPDDPENWIGLDYVHDRVMSQLDRQEARWKEVDDRLRFLLGVIGVIFAAGGGFMKNGLLIRDDLVGNALMPSWM